MILLPFRVLTPNTISADYSIADPGFLSYGWFVKTSILGIGTALPPYAYTQDEVFALAGYRQESIRRLLRATAIERRFLAFEKNHLPQEESDWFHQHYAKWSVKLGVEAGFKALERSSLRASEVDYLIATSCTGYLCPGLNLRLARELGLGPRVKTANLVGMGCSAMIPALERADEFSHRHVGKNVLVVASEICSASYWLDEQDLESVVGNALFSDGASAAVLRAEDERANRGKRKTFLEAFVTSSNRELLGAMGFSQKQGRLKVRLDSGVPSAVLDLADDVATELSKLAGLHPSELKHWILHPGGRKILEQAESRWGFQKELESSWRVMRKFGNMSSATILFVLEDYLTGGQTPRSQEYGLMIAMGPGLSAEGVLLRWS
ncbi:MAG: type III polyketide synthase [Bdellovibrionota bacterium]